ncbi:WSC-domain-containing protein, partial [Colletotrichum zoysiae]
PTVPDNISNKPAGNTQPPGLIPRGASAQRGNVLRRVVTGISDTLPGPWTYMGCFTEAGSSRALSGDRYSGDDMSQEKCISYCNGKGYSNTADHSLTVDSTGMAGVEYGRECYCGYVLDPASSIAAETDCSMPCAGGSSGQVFGNGGRLNVFTNGDSGPTVLAASGDFQSRGCYSDHTSSRTLSTRISLPGALTVSECTTACAAQGFPCAGVEFGKECFCGTSIQNGTPIASSSCNMACAGDKTQYCGGASAINIYISSKPLAGSPSAIPYGWTQTCYTDSTNRRALLYKVPISKFSAAQCVSQCDSLGYKYAGVEYGSECYCGNSIDGGNTPASSGCDMPCDGNRLDKCGGAGRINIYEFNCKGTRGCGNSNVAMDVGHANTLNECSDRCQADLDCMSFSFGPDGTCSTFKTPVAMSLLPGSESACSTMFYDRACS